MDINLEIGRKYNLILKRLPVGSNLQVVIPNAKFHAVNYDKNVPAMEFQYGECRGIPQKITLMPGHLETAVEVNPQSSEW